LAQPIELVPISGHKKQYIVTCTPLIRRVLVRMNGLFSVGYTLIITHTGCVMSRLHQLQFTVAHALGFSRSTSRLPATDIDAQL
jgi:hypothetical protein